MHTFDDLTGREFYLALPQHGPKGAAARRAMVLAGNFCDDHEEASGKTAGTGIELDGEGETPIGVAAATIVGVPTAVVIVVAAVVVTCAVTVNVPIIVGALVAVVVIVVAVVHLL